MEHDPCVLEYYLARCLRPRRQTNRPLFRSPITQQTDDAFRSCTHRTTSQSAKTLRGGWNANPQRIFKNWPSGRQTATFAMAAANGAARRAKRTARHWAWTIGYGRQRRSTGVSSEISRSWKTTYDVTLQARRDLSTRPLRLRSKQSREFSCTNCWTVPAEF